MSKPIKETLSSEFQSVEASATKNNLAIILDSLDVSKGNIKITETLVETMGSSGISMKNACSLLHKKFNWLNDNPTMLAAFERGRANLGSKMRGKLVEQALEHNNVQSAIYLDKILTGDSVATEVNLTVGASQLSTVSDEDLMKVAFTVESIDEGFTMEATVDETLSGEMVDNSGGGGHTPG